MTDVIQRLILEAEVGDTERQLKDVRKRQKELAGEIQDAGKAANRTADQNRELLNSYRDLIDTEQALKRSINDTNDAYGDRSKVIKATDQFDRTSQGVALAGDVESNLRTVGGAAGAFGFGGVERGIGQAAEVPALLEALPRLSDSIKGLPGVANEAAKALNTNVATLGALAVATAALGVAINVTRGIADKAEAGFRGQIDAQTQAIELSRTVSREELEERKKEAELQIQIAQEQRDTTKQIYDDLQTSIDENLGTVGAGVARFNAILGISGSEDSLSGAIEASARAAEDAKTNLEGAGNELDAINLALESSELAARDAAEAERRLAEERIKSAFAAADAAEREVITQQKVEGFSSKEEAQRAADAAEDEIERLEARIPALEAVAHEDEQAAESLETLRQKIADLKSDVQLFNDAAGSLQTEDQIAKEKSLESARKQAALATDEAYQAELNKITSTRDATLAAQSSTAGGRTPSGRNRLGEGDFFFGGASDTSTTSSSGAGSARSAPDTSNRDRAREVNQQFGEDIANLEKEFNREREAEARRNKDELQRIDRDRKRAEKDSVLERNFDAAIGAREAANDQKKELAIQARIEARERQISFNDRRQDLTDSYRQQLNDLRNAETQKLQIQNQALTNSVQMYQQWATGIQQITKEQFLSLSASSRDKTSGQRLENAFSYVTG